MDVLDYPELADDPRFEKAGARGRHRSQLKTIIEEILLTQSAPYWLERMRHLLAGLVRTLDEALCSDEVKARNMVQTIIEDDGSEKQLLGSVFKFENTPVQVASQPPRHGQNTSAVLSELLGLDKSKIEELRTDGTIR